MNNRKKAIVQKNFQTGDLSIKLNKEADLKILLHSQRHKIRNEIITEIVITEEALEDYGKYLGDGKFVIDVRDVET